MNNSNKLEQLREEHELTKTKLAQILGVSDSIYCRWENNICSIPTKRIYQLANYYEINIDYLIGFVNERKKIKSSDKINKELVSNRVRNMIKIYGKSLEALADELGTSKSTISAYQTGKTLILYTFLMHLCKSTNCSVDWILGRQENMYIK